MIGSSDITLTQLKMSHGDLPGRAPESNEITIDGTSSDVTVSKSRFCRVSQDAVLVKAGARQVTLTTNLVDESLSDYGFTLDGTTGAIVTSNTMLLQCSNSSNGVSVLTLADGSSGTVENNIFEPEISGTGCTAPQVGLSVDASSANSAGGVTADYNAFYTNGSASDYSWAGASYQDPAAFTAATGQGAHDLTLTREAYTPLVPGSAAINSANCSALGELSTDIFGNPWVADPQASDASAGSGTCNASRGAYAPQEPDGDYRHRPGEGFGRVRSRDAAVHHRGDGHRQRHQRLGRGRQLHGQLRRRQCACPAAVGTPVDHTYATAGEYAITITAADTERSTTSVTVGQSTLSPIRRRWPGSPPRPMARQLLRHPARPRCVHRVGRQHGLEHRQHHHQLRWGGHGLHRPPPANWEYAYAQPGAHTATITVTDKLGRTSHASASITVGDEQADVNPFTDYDHSVAAHGTIKLSLDTLTDGDCCARGAFVELIVSADKQAGYITMYPDGATRPGLAAVHSTPGSRPRTPPWLPAARSTSTTTAPGASTSRSSPTGSTPPRARTAPPPARHSPRSPRPPRSRRPRSGAARRSRSGSTGSTASPPTRPTSSWM